MNIKLVVSLGLSAAVAIGGCRGAETGDGAGSDAGRTQVEVPQAPVAGQGTSADGQTLTQGGSVDGAAGGPFSPSPTGSPAGSPGSQGVAQPAAPGRPAAGTAPPATASTPDATAVLSRAEEVYASVRSMEADFSQSVEVPLLGQTVRSQGKLYHRSPDRFLMQFSQPQGDVVVADGRHLWMFYPSVDARQVMRTTMAAAGGQVDLHREFLSNPTERYHAVLSGVEAVGGRATHVVVLTPRTRSGYRQVRIWVDREDALVRRFEITEENESVRTLELRNIRRNPTLPDQLFQFSPPAGAQIFEQ
ncbi:MAG: outer membrane lipoprotein chaperone LolA [Gemmatimonadetes bacterium]|nr:outer membrane lipoprotein chaperone LolA [Gemmatimonadota bacterium]